MEFDEGNDVFGEEVINKVGGDEEGFGEELEFGVDFDDLIYEDLMYFLLEFSLVVYVFGIGYCLVLLS